jgi:hypothetical protein
MRACDLNAASGHSGAASRDPAFPYKPPEFHQVGTNS